MNTVPTAAVKIRAGCMNTMTMKYTNTDLTKSCSCGMRYKAAIPGTGSKENDDDISQCKDDCENEICYCHEQIRDQVIECGWYCVKGICGYHA